MLKVPLNVLSYRFASYNSAKGLFRNYFVVTFKVALTYDSKSDRTYWLIKCRMLPNSHYLFHNVHICLVLVV